MEDIGVSLFVNQIACFDFCFTEANVYLIAVRIKIESNLVFVYFRLDLLGLCSF